MLFFRWNTRFHRDSDRKWIEDCQMFLLATDVKWDQSILVCFLEGTATPRTHTDAHTCIYREREGDGAIIRKKSGIINDRYRALSMTLLCIGSAVLIRQRCQYNIIYKFTQNKLIPPWDLNLWSEPVSCRSTYIHSLYGIKIIYSGEYYGYENSVRMILYNRPHYFQFNSCNIWFNYCKKMIQ